MNYSPVKGVLANFSPHQIVKKRNISFKQECAMPLGTYVQAYVDKMLGDYNTKPLNGAPFRQMRKKLIGMS